MCIIAIVPKDKSISKNTLHNMFRNNPDGAGIGYVDKNNNKLTIIKGIFTSKELYEKYKYAKENTNSYIIIHCRLATHGQVNAEMCHPFFVNEHLLFAHNGIIFGMPVDKTKSDTYYFNELVLKSFKEGFETNQYILDILDKSLGYNKLVFLNDKGNISVTNIEGWIDYKGITYSNDTFLDYDEYIDGEGKISKYQLNEKDWSDDCYGTITENYYSFE